MGATLAKLVVRDASGAIQLQLLPAEPLASCANAVGASRAGRVGLTGGGAGELRRLLSRSIEAMVVDEFAAWGAGASAMLERSSGGSNTSRYLLVSLGTGTSVLLVDGSSVTRVGGTALGGGTMVGLGAAMLGTSHFPSLAELAARGSRRQVDLLVSDIYPTGDFPLAGEITASNFGKLARRLDAGERVGDEDIANAIMGLVGENVSLVCQGLAAASRANRILFAGSTLRANPVLRGVLEGITRALGREPEFLPQGEFAGALGALRIAAGES